MADCLEDRREDGADDDDEDAVVVLDDGCEFGDWEEI
jgi:hypothetical protein